MAYRQTARVQEQLQDKRDRILQAVRAVVGEVGFHGAQIAVVAEAAGIAAGTIYRHFPSKGELFAETLALNSRHEIDVMAAVARCRGFGGIAAGRCRARLRLPRRARASPGLCHVRRAGRARSRRGCASSIAAPSPMSCKG